MFIEILTAAMNDLKFYEDLIDNEHSTTCGLLHASDVACLKVTDDKRTLDESNPFLMLVIKLLGLTQRAFANALCT